MNVNKEAGTKLGYFYKEIMDYFYRPDDGTIANKIAKKHPELDFDCVRTTANKGVFLRRIKDLTGINPEDFINSKIEIEPRLVFDVADCIINAMDKKDKTIIIYLFCENVDEKVALEAASEFNNIGFNAKIYHIFRNKLFGLTTQLDLFLNDYVSYLSLVSKLNNVLTINPSKLSFFLGAGCSVDANIGEWQQLNDALSFELLSSEDNYGLTNYGSKEVNESVVEALSRNFDRNSLVDIAVRKKKKEVSKTLDYFKYVHDILYMNYDETKFDYKTNVLESISNCIKRIKMKKIVTYNFDSTLEKNLNDNYRACNDEVKNSKSCIMSDDVNIEIFHVHGYLPYDYDGVTIAGNFILSDIDFYLNSKDSNGVPNLIQTNILNSNDVIFIGCSFNDSNIKQILLSLDENRNNRIYAIMKIPSFKELIIGQRKKEIEISSLKYKTLLNNYLNYYGVKIIWVNDFKEIPAILDQIKESDDDIEIDVDSICKNL